MLILHLCAPPLFFPQSYNWSFTPFVRTSSAQTLEKFSRVEANVLPFKMAAAASRASPQDVNRCGRQGRGMFPVKVGELPQLDSEARLKVLPPSSF